MVNVMIKIENYSLNAGSFSLKNINLEIKKGEIFAILGQTGSGKTLLMESIAGFYANHTGNIFYDGHRIHDILLEERNISFVYQDFALFPHMTVRQNIEYGMRMRRIKKSICRQRSSEMMELLGITHLENSYAGTLSGGEQQRTALARALVTEPEVLFMDEPFSALDPNTKKQMYELVKRMHKIFDCTIIFVTHDFSEAQLLSDRTAVLVDGAVRQVSDSRRLFDMCDDSDVAKFLGCA